MRSLSTLVLPAFLVGPVLLAQQPASPPPDARFKADILLVSPHPDDESTIAGYLAKAAVDEHRRIAVVFTTRGDAGGNLVGTEQGQALGEIREAETRQALGFLGITNVWFLRVPDTPGEDVSDVLRSLGNAHHGEALAQLVRFMRITRPEVVIAMLPATVVGENHEDHQASAVIATEAFDLAGDPTWFPEQLGAAEDRLWYGNLMEGLRAWQPKKLYYYTDATHFEFMKGKGPEYPMTAVSPARHESYGRLAAEETGFHLTQYGDQVAHDLATNNLAFYEQTLPFVLAKSLVSSLPTADIMDAVGGAPVAFAPVAGYRTASMPDFSVELGGGWAFYRRFYQAHDLAVMSDLLPPELGVGSRSHVSVPLVLHNNTAQDVTFHLNAQLPPGWTVDSTSAQHSHPWPATSFLVAAHSDAAVRIRVVSPTVAQSTWQNLTWTATVNGQATAPATLRVFVYKP
jgi:LmbE family N-acetylglucosaminyl deacetylase